MDKSGKTEPVKSAVRKRKHKANWTGEREGFKHQLISALVSKSFQYREAGQVINAVFDSMKEALLRHEPVELPFGILRVVSKPEPLRTWNFGKLTWFYLRRHKVVFEPKDTTRQSKQQR